MLEKHKKYLDYFFLVGISIILIIVLFLCGCAMYTTFTEKEVSRKEVIVQERKIIKGSANKKVQINGVSFVFAYQMEANEDDDTFSYYFAGDDGYIYKSKASLSNLRIKESKDNEAKIQKIRPYCRYKRKIPFTGKAKITKYERGQGYTVLIVPKGTLSENKSVKLDN